MSDKNYYIENITPEDECAKHGKEMMFRKKNLPLPSTEPYFYTTEYVHVCVACLFANIKRLEKIGGAGFENLAKCKTQLSDSHAENERLQDDLSDDSHRALLEAIYAKGISHKEHVAYLINIVKHCDEGEDEHGMCTCAHAIGEALAAKDEKHEKLEAKNSQLKKTILDYFDRLCVSTHLTNQEPVHTAWKMNLREKVIELIKENDAPENKIEELEKQSFKSGPILCKETKQ